MESSTLKRFVVPAALVVGGVTAGSFLAPIGLASADDAVTEDDDTTSTDESTTDDPDDTTADDGTDDDADSRGHRHGGRGRGGHRFGADHEVLEETLGLTAEEIRSGLADGKSIADLAEEQGVSTDDLISDLVTAASEAIDEAVADGRLDEDRAATAKENLEERVTAMVERSFDGSARPDGGRGRGGPGRLGSLEALEDLLGLSAEEIRSALADGSSLADLAEEQGVSADEVAEVLTADALERIDEAVADGRVDEDRAETAKENLEERVDELVESEGLPGGGRGRGGHGGRGGHHGHDADADGTTGTDSSGETESTSLEMST